MQDDYTDDEPTVLNEEQAPLSDKARAWIIGAIACSIIAAFTFIGGWWLGLEAGRQQSLGDSSELRASGPTSAISGTTVADTRQQFDVYWDVWDLVSKEFYHEQPLDQKRLIYGSIKGMLEELEDPYTVFQEPEAASHSREQMNGGFDGIGARVDFIDGELTVTSPIPGTPADRAGIRSGDKILEVDGKDLSEILKAFDESEAASEGAKLIRGQKGTKVRLKVLRPSTGEISEHELEREEIPLISVTSSMFGDVAYVRIGQFANPTPEQLDSALKQLLEQQPRGLILDLRDNPGGLVDSAQEVMGRFVEDGVVMHWRYADGSMKESKVKRDQGEAVTNYDLPMIVLVNNGSASASEIVAGALRDYERATLLGERTYGKGSVQNVHKLDDDSSARITIARWLTPLKEEIHEKGILPRYIVPPSDDAAQYPIPCPDERGANNGERHCGDAQIAWAIKLLRGEGTPPPPPTATAEAIPPTPATNR